MSFDPVFYILKEASFLPADEARSWLGRIVSHFTAPHYGFVPEDATSLNQRKVKIQELTDVEQVVKASKGKSYEPQLQGVVQACAKKTNGVDFDFKTAKLQILQLQEHEEIFAHFLQLCAQDLTVDTKIRSWAKPFGEPLYMIVGVMIWTDAKFGSTKTTDQDTSFQITAPLNAVANAVSTSQLGMPVVPSGIGDISMGINSNQTNETTVHATQSGNSIFAVEYRVIRRLKHTAFTKFGLDAELPRFLGQRTFAGHENVADEEGPEASEMKRERLRLEDDDVPWTESLDDMCDAPPVEVEQLSGVDVGLCFASEVDT